MSKGTHKSIQYKEMTDEEIIAQIHLDDEFAQDYLIHKYKNLVKIKARTYFIMGADKEDIIQEGMIGLYKAIRDYNPFKAVSFYSFAELCITRQMITAIKSATRQKHIPLNSYLSLNKKVYEEDGEKTYMDELQEVRITNPEDLFIGKEDKKYIEAYIGKALSKFENTVLALYLEGNSYLEIAKIVEKDEKSIDNALQRVRKKVEKIIDEKNLTKLQNYAKI